ncbi:MAG: RNA polymerase subunit sigma-24 [Alphaproteobacteria bacterium HGW-Alphaproteobacteria-1]|jgi:RNA polymerase sigma-70 factor (ECF subfamily)|nr:MAG: RNA polymerase subunit sigma-24 [Alphaproteobacteria bacterium HGW-Alphaproteobacteria-1]
MSEDRQDERKVIALLAVADSAAFEHVYRKHNGAMLRLCAGIVKNQATAEEVVQETWVAVLENIQGFEGRSSLAGWIYAILMNKARTRLKRDGRSISFEDNGEVDSLQAAFDGRGRWKDRPELWDDLTPERILSGKTALDHVARAITRLPPAQRAVLLLRGQADLDPAEICDILDISAANMRVLLHRARLAIRDTLDELQEPSVGAAEVRR